jgi:hypothetical protein
MSFIFWSMPYQLFQSLGERERQDLTQHIDLLNDLIEPNQKSAWIDFFCGGVPKGKLKWKGSLQEAYYLFNQIRIASLNSHSMIRIQTKNRGLDWVKINKVVLTRFGKVQKESRPQTTDNIDLSIQLFLTKMNKF